MSSIFYHFRVKVGKKVFIIKKPPLLQKSMAPKMGQASVPALSVGIPCFFSDSSKSKPWLLSPNIKRLDLSGLLPCIVPAHSQRDIIRRGGAKGGCHHAVKVLTGLKSGTSRKSARSQRDIIRRSSGAKGGCLGYPIKVLTGSKSKLGTFRKSDRSQCDIIRRGGAKAGSRHPVKVLTGSKLGHVFRKSDRSQCDIIRRGGAKGGCPLPRQSFDRVEARHVPKIRSILNAT